MARLFFALWPDPAVAGVLGEEALRLAGVALGKAVPANKIHLTLAFLGEIDPARMDGAREAAAMLRAPPLRFVLDTVGSFGRAKVAWAGCSAPPPALAELQSRLGAGLRGRGFRLDERDFAPHVTLARAIAKAVPPAPMPPLEWNSSDFTLVRSETGTGRYSVLEKWPLKGA